MYQLLKKGVKLASASGRDSYTVGDFLGSGGQGEVYTAQGKGTKLAVKWYFPHSIDSDPKIRRRLEKAIASGPPDGRFLWPIDIVVAKDRPGFGYLMGLRERRFKGIRDMMLRKAEPSFYALATAGYALADSYHQLHAAGLCYRDVSWGNVFLDPDSGDIRICDNDNVDENGVAGVIAGTPMFMAPEIVRGEAEPTAETDRYSLAVLFFYMFFLHHPLDGAREQKIHVKNLAAMRKLYGTEPLFIFDPSDKSNRPDPATQSNPLQFAPIYPRFFKDVFLHAFTVGLRDPKARIRENMWRSAMIKLRDSMTTCNSCGAHLFWDFEVTPPRPCWSCRRAVDPPSVLHLGKKRIVLRAGATLFPHHLDPNREYDLSVPLAEIVSHTKENTVLGVKNVSGRTWMCFSANGAMQEVPPGKSVRTDRDLRVNFGSSEGSFSKG